MVIRELAIEYKSSDLPVREAIRMLQSEGLAVVNKNRGACVITQTPEDIPGAYLLRGELEALATRLAGPHLTAQDIDSLDRMSRDMEIMVLQDAREPYVALNKKFHALIFQRCPYANIRRELEQLWDGSFDYGMIFGIDTKQLSKSSSHHLQLVECLRVGDWDQAANISRGRKLEIARFLLVALNRPIPPGLFPDDEHGAE